jgi:hypothetical protein
MQFTHKLLAQMLMQGNARSSQADENFGRKRKATMLEDNSHANAKIKKRSKNTRTASEKAPKDTSERFR